MNAVPPKDLLARLGDVVDGAHPKPGHGPLIQALGAALPELEIRLVYTRRGWHRPGGIIDGHGNRIADNLVQWVEAEAGDDALDLFVRFENAGLLATRLCGTTHYLTAKTGEGPWDFIQIEVEELREIADRQLFTPSHPPDAPEDLIDPVEPTQVDPTPLGPAFYTLRQALNIAEAHGRMTAGSYADNLLALRFVDDWQASSASRFDLSKFFVLRLEDYQDRFGDKRLQATPLPTYVRTLPPFPPGAARGLELARFLTAFDRAVGYPMAWFFHMVAGAEPQLQAIAHAVHEDVSGAYDYLPQRDVAVLQDWAETPYAF